MTGGLFPGVPLHVVRRELARANAAFGHDLRRVPRENWPGGPRAESRLVEVYRSRAWLVQIFDERPKAYLRMTVSRTSIGDDRRWKDGITWDELMELKRQAGHGERHAVELYPADADVVNVANMRHLWLLDEPPAFAWRDGDTP